MKPFTIIDSQAEMTLLTGDDWAPWFKASVDGATQTIHLSIYMISSHWRTLAAGGLDLVAALEAAARRGVECRAIIDRPNVPGRREPFNVKAALRLQEAGWKVRVMPDARTLHEKILLIDRRVSVIGSHNLSKASATTNYDTSLAVDSTPLAALVYRQFWQRWRIATPL